MRPWSLLPVLVLPACGFGELPSRPDAGPEPVPVVEPAAPETAPPALYRLPDGGTLQVETTARESRRIRDVAPHAGAAYYVVSEPTGLRRWSPAEGITPLAESESVLGFRVVTDGTSAYWMSYQGSGSVQGTRTLLRTPLAGGTTVPLVSDGASPSGLAHHAGQLYFMDFSGASTVSVDGGRPRRLAPLTVPQLFVVDDGGAWVVTFDALVQVPLVGGTPRRVFSLPSGAQVRALATSAAHVDLLMGLCTAPAPNVFLVRVPKAGGDAQLLGAGVGCSGPAAMDESHAYWLGAEGGGGTPTSLYRLPRAASGALQWLVADLEYSEVLAVGESHVYWTSEDGRQLLRVPKP